MSREWFVVICFGQNAATGRTSYVVHGTGFRARAVSDPSDALSDVRGSRAINGWRKRENAAARAETRRDPDTGKLIAANGWSVRLYYFDDGTDAMVLDPEQPADPDHPCSECGEPIEPSCPYSTCIRCSADILAPDRG